MDIFGPTTSLKIRKLNNYRHGFKCNTCDYKTADKGNLKRQKNLFMMVSKNSSAKHL